MQKYLLPFGLAIALIILTAYLLTILNPFDEAMVAELISSQSIKSSAEFIELVRELSAKGLIIDYLNIKNIAIIAATGLSAIIFLFFSIHLVIDKLFVKKFYEQPSLITAGHRAVIFALGIAGVIISKVYAGSWYYALIWVALMIVLELLLWKMLQRPAVHKEGEEIDTDREVTFFQKYTRGLSFNPRGFRKMVRAGIERFNLRRNNVGEGEE